MFLESREMESWCVADENRSLTGVSAAYWKSFMILLQWCSQRSFIFYTIPKLVEGFLNVQLPRPHARHQMLLAAYSIFWLGLGWIGDCDQQQFRNFRVAQVWEVDLVSQYTDDTNLDSPRPRVHPLLGKSFEEKLQDLVNGVPLST